MGAAGPKQYLPLHGMTVLEHTLARIAGHPHIAATVVVIAATDRPDLARGLVLISPFVRYIKLPWWMIGVFKAILAPPWGRFAWIWGIN